MILDYIDGTDYYVLTVKRGELDIQTLITDHGLDYSTPRSTADQAVLFTREPYAAATFAEYGTPRAKEMLRGILDQIALSRRDDGPTPNYSPPSGQALWPFQRASLAYALGRKHCLIGDQPGLGKTPIGISYCNELRAKRVLVICPGGIRYQWYRKIQEWSTMPQPFHTHTVVVGNRGVNDTAPWTIVSYDLARTVGIGRALAQGQYDVLILDEAHYLKTIDTHRTRAVFGGGAHRDFAPIAGRAEHILALTGTPLPNRPREAYTLAKGLCFDAIDWLSEDAFSERFNPSIRREGIDPKTGHTRFYIDERTGRHAELQNRLRGNFMTRHLKRDVLTQLKMPAYDIIQLEATGPIKQALAAERLLDIDPETLQGRDSAAFGEVATVRRMMGVAMAPQVAAYVAMLIDGGEEKIVLFAWHHEVLDILEKALHKYGVVRIDGSTGPKRKDALIQQFILNPHIQVCLGQMQVMGVGTDGLQQVSCHGLIAEPDWVPGNNEQAFDRLDRAGQTRQVQGDIFVAPNSFAERVLAAALRKHQTTDRVLDRQGAV